jgi:hypothetical protein
MRRLTLVCTLAASLCHAQVPPVPAQSIPPRGTSYPDQAYPASLSVRDPQEWNGPLASIIGENRFYRTFSAGHLSDLPAVGALDPNALLIGFEISTVQETLSSIQPYYLVNGRRVAGPLVGDIKGARTQIVAREGYAVREVRLNSKDTLTGFHVLFARRQPDGTLSETDLLSSNANGQAATTLHAGGLPFCGVLATGQKSVDSLTLLVSQQLTQTLKPNLVPVARQRPVDVIPPGSRFSRGIPGGIPTGPQGAMSGGPGSLPPGVIPISPLTPVAGTATSAPAPAPSDPLADGRLGELVRTTGESLIFVEGADGQGSGFICMLNGKRVLVTNQHVIRGNPAMQFTTLNQAAVKVGPARTATAHDIIVYDVTDPVPALEATTDFAQSVSVGDEVVVLGNTEGARVIKPLAGKVVGVGPNLVEISSEFLPGNSGSPIIHLKSGKVIGIATYAIVRDVNSLTGQRQASVRRFGYRLDSVQNWQPVNWAIYQAEAAATKKISDFSGAIINLLVDVRSRRFDATKHSDSRLRPALNCLATLNRSGTTQVDRMQLVKNFLGEIRNAAQRDVNDLKPRLRYDYFQRELADESKFRTEIYTGLGEAMQKLR